MNIQIGKFKITSDSTQFILSVEGVRGIKSKEVGEKYDDVCGCYSDIHSCLIGIHRHLLLKSDAILLSEVIDLIQEYKKIIMDIYGPKTFTKAVGSFKRKVV
jgi:hypothetical protein